MKGCKLNNKLITGVVILLLNLFSLFVQASEKDERRINVGLKLFPAVIAADSQLVEKVVRISKELGREIASPYEARLLLGLRKLT